MSGAVFTGTLTHWSEADGVGQVTKLGESEPSIVVFSEAFAGLPEPRVGMRLLYELGTGRAGVTAAVNLRP